MTSVKVYFYSRCNLARTSKRPLVLGQRSPRLSFITPSPSQRESFLLSTVRSFPVQHRYRARTAQYSRGHIRGHLRQNDLARSRSHPKQGLVSDDFVAMTSGVFSCWNDVERSATVLSRLVHPTALIVLYWYIYSPYDLSGIVRGYENRARRVNYGYNQFKPTTAQLSRTKQTVIGQGWPAIELFG